MDAVNKVEYPFDYHELDSDEAEELVSYFKEGIFTKFIRLGPHGHFFYKEFDSVVLDIYNMPLRPSDIFVVSLPRSGTTWTQELVWLLKNNLDFEAAKTTKLFKRFPFIESTALLKLNFPEETLKFKKKVLTLEPKTIGNLPDPRFIKTHVPLSLLPPKLLDTVKVVYVARHPLDVAVSNFYFMKFTEYIDEDKEFKPYWNFFMQSKTLWTPYFTHVKEAWRQRNHPNMFFVFYEELLKDLRGTAKRVATFLSEEYSEDQYEALCRHLHFDNLKNNESIVFTMKKESGQTFFRQGKSGGWREHFDAEMTQQAERWIADNLRDTDLRFPQ